LKVGWLLTSENLTVDVADFPDLAISEDQTMIQEIQSESGWEIPDDTFDVGRIEALNMKILERRFEDIKGIVVITEGK
jgi:hypothetical protein